MELVQANSPNPENAVVGDKPSDLDRILEPSTNISIWQRESEDVHRAVKDLMDSSFQKTQFIFDRNEPLEMIGVYLDDSAPAPSDYYVHLWADIMQLAGKMLQLCDDKLVGIGLERVTHDNCKSFHIDYLSLRMICTYWGEATEWLANTNVNRMGLGHNDNAKVVRDWGQVHKMEEQWVGIFKGDNYPGNKGLGVVHRSPEVLGKSHSDRLLLRIDTIESFGRRN